MRSVLMKLSSDSLLEYRHVPMVGKLNMNQFDGEYGILEVSDEFKRSVFDAIREDGMVYDSEHGAHISVFNDKEMEFIRERYVDIIEDGREYVFELKSVESVDPEGWDEMERVWFVVVDCKELECLRRKYGFTGLMNVDHEFHITIAVKPRKEDLQSRRGRLNHES